MSGSLGGVFVARHRPLNHVIRPNQRHEFELFATHRTCTGAHAVARWHFSPARNVYRAWVRLKSPAAVHYIATQFRDRVDIVLAAHSHLTHCVRYSFPRCVRLITRNTKPITVHW